MLTGSEDRTVKCWDWAPVADPDIAATTAPVKLQAKFTVLAHDKDINGLAVSPNDKLFATASQDRTAKVRAAIVQPMRRCHELVTNHTHGVVVYLPCFFLLFFSSFLVCVLNIALECS